MEYRWPQAACHSPKFLRIDFKEILFGRNKTAPKISVIGSQNTESRHKIAVPEVLRLLYVVRTGASRNKSDLIFWIFVQFKKSKLSQKELYFSSPKAIFSFIICSGLSQRTSSGLGAPLGILLSHRYMDLDPY